MNAVVVFPWTADSDIVTADSDFYTASGYGPVPSSPQFPYVPPFPGVPNLARLQTAAEVAASASQSGLAAAIDAQLGLSANVTAIAL